MSPIFGPKPDLPPPEPQLPLDQLCWKSEDAERSLGRIYRHVVDGTQSAIDWYMRAIRRKRWVAYTIRFFAILLVAVAGLIPLLDSVHEKYVLPADRLPWVEMALDTAWATVILAVAAALVGLDRFFGYSSGWMRFIRTELELRRLLVDFELDWQRHRASWQGRPPLPTQVDLALQRCRDLSRQVNDVVHEETSLWIQEFRDSLRQADESLKQQVAERERMRADEDSGGINVVVTNAEECEGRRWGLSIDAGGGSEYTGKSAAVSGLPPGVHHVRVFGIIGGTEKQAQVVASVPRGGVNAVELTLS